MPDYRGALEHEGERFDLPAGGLDRLFERRRRRQRNQRLGALLVALVLVTGGGWFVSRVFSTIRTGPRPAAPPISPANVSRLRVAWTAHMGGRPSDPVVAGDIVYVVADRLYAFEAHCRTSCRLLWTGGIGQGSSGHPPVVADGVVIVSSNRLYAFPAQCADSTCSPLWAAVPPVSSGSEETTSIGFSAPTVSNGLVYVTSEKGLYTFALRCRSDGGTCAPLWIGEGSGGAGAPAIEDGMVYFLSHTKLWAFTAVCPRRRCAPAWSVDWPPPEVTESSSAVVASNGTLYASGVAVSASCGATGSCKPLWIVGTSSGAQDVQAGIVSAATVSGDVVYESSTRVYALPAQCGTKGSGCPPLWTGPTQREEAIAGFHLWSQPTVANGLVFSATDRPYAFTVGCSSGGAECQPVWVGPRRIAQIFSRVTLSSSAAYVTGSDGTLFAFTVDGR